MLCEFPPGKRTPALQHYTFQVAHQPGVNYTHTHACTHNTHLHTCTYAQTHYTLHTTHTYTHVHTHKHTHTRAHTGRTLSTVPQQSGLRRTPFSSPFFCFLFSRISNDSEHKARQFFGRCSWVNGSAPRRSFCCHR